MPATTLNLAEQTARLNRLRSNVSAAMLGKPEAVEFALIALLAEGHLLIEDVPGIGKTLLAKTLARSLGCTFHRIQFTPDLLPGDLLGTSVFHQASSTFVFQKGPIFAQIVLADEINRSTPRTQSALLEAMSDRQVSIDGETRPLGPPFCVLATQNPHEFEGTYPLPESQLDRFLIRLRIGYPDRVAERQILVGHRDGEPIERVGSVLTAEEVIDLQKSVRQIRFEDPLAEYLLDLVAATREDNEIVLGASTRAALGFYRAAQAAALVAGRDFVTPDDIKRLARPVLAHRLLVRRSRAGHYEAAGHVVDEIVRRTPIPG